MNNYRSVRRTEFITEELKKIKQVQSMTVLLKMQNNVSIVTHSHHLVVVITLP